MKQLFLPFENIDPRKSLPREIREAKRNGYFTGESNANCANSDKLRENICEIDDKSVNSHSYSRNSRLHSWFIFQNLLKAYHDCRKRKRKTANAAKFEINFESELLKLEKELQNHTYQPGKSICFVVTYPTSREIFAADFHDRIVHHLLIAYLEPIFEKKFIHHSFACRNNKGTHAAVKFLKKFTRQSTKNFSQVSYYLQADISAFFMSLKKDILYKLIEKQVRNPEILWLTEKIIFHDPTKNFYRKGDPKLADLIPTHKSLFHIPKNQGLPIGNLTSQFFANVYLNSLDQFVKHTLKARYYLRYMDDFILIHKSPTQLSKWKKQIDIFLKEELKLRLHPKKSIQQSIYKGVNFAGFVVKPHSHLIRRRTVGNLKKKIWQFNSLPFPQNDEIFEGQLTQILAVINSYYGQFAYANTYNLRKSLYYKNFKILKTYLEPSDNDFTFFRVKIFSKEPAENSP